MLSSGSRRCLRSVERARPGRRRRRAVGDDVQIACEGASPQRASRAFSSARAAGSSGTLATRGQAQRRRPRREFDDLRLIVDPRHDDAELFHRLAHDLGRGKRTACAEQRAGNFSRKPRVWPACSPTARPPASPRSRAASRRTPSGSSDRRPPVRPTPRPWDPCWVDRRRRGHRPAHRTRRDRAARYRPRRGRREAERRSFEPGGPWRPFRSAANARRSSDADQAFPRKHGPRAVRDKNRVPSIGSDWPPPRGAALPGLQIGPREGIDIVGIVGRRLIQVRPW